MPAGDDDTACSTRPACFVCNLLLRGPFRSLGVDGALIVGIVNGYAQGRTQEVIDWVGGDVCERHARMFEKATASVARSLKGDGT